VQGAFEQNWMNAPWGKKSLTWFHRKSPSDPIFPKEKRKEKSENKSGLNARKKEKSCFFLCERSIT
jgi:hypothetical protein